MDETIGFKLMKFNDWWNDFEKLKVKLDERLELICKREEYNSLMCFIVGREEHEQKAKSLEDEVYGIYKDIFRNISMSFEDLDEYSNIISELTNNISYCERDKNFIYSNVLNDKKYLTKLLQFINDDILNEFHMLCNCCTIKKDNTIYYKWNRQNTKVCEHEYITIDKEIYYTHETIKNKYNENEHLYLKNKDNIRMIIGII